VELRVSNRHKEIRPIIRKAFREANWQMSHIHFVKNILRKVPGKKGKEYRIG